MSTTPAAPEAIALAGIHELDAFLEAGAYDSVIARSAELISQGQNLYPHYLLRGVAFKKLGAIEDAIACFGKVLELEPGERAALIQIARCLQAVGRVDEAIPYLAENFYLYPDENSGSQLALAAVEAKAADLTLMDMVIRSG